MLRNKCVEKEKDIDLISGEGGYIDTLDSRVSNILKELKAIKNSYIGNKRKLIPCIIKMLDKNKIEYNSVLDLFSGSNFVSISMKLLGKQTFSNDILAASHINALVFVQNKDIILTDEDKKFLFSKKDEYIISGNKYLDKYFGKYSNIFSEREINVIRNYLSRMSLLNIMHFGRSSNDIDMKGALAFVSLQHYIINHCFVGGRLNNGQILANYNHRIKHDKNKGGEMFSSDGRFSISRFKWVRSICLENTNNHRCYNTDAIKLLDLVPKVDLCYIDPPYGGEQSDYGYMYKIFEEMLYYKSYDKIKSSDHNKFVNSKNYEEHFNELIKKANHIPTLLISYNNSSWADIDKIISCIKRYRSNVVVENIQYKYKYRIETEDSKEYLILAR